MIVSRGESSIVSSEETLTVSRGESSIVYSEETLIISREETSIVSRDHQGKKELPTAITKYIYCPTPIF